MPALIGKYKVCSKCKQTKPTTEFSKCKSRKDGYNYSCKSCEKTRIALYKSQHKNELRDSYKEYYNLHKEQEKLRVKTWSQLPQSKNKIRDKVKKYYYSNKETLNDKRRIQRQTDVGKVKVQRANHLRRTRTLQTVNDLSLGDINLLLQIQNNKCGCCNRTFSKELAYTVDHIVPVKLGGSLTLSNVQLLCRKCNSSKGAKVIRYVYDSRLYGG